MDDGSRKAQPRDLLIDRVYDKDLRRDRFDIYKIGIMKAAPKITKTKLHAYRLASIPIERLQHFGGLEFASEALRIPLGKSYRVKITVDFIDKVPLGMQKFKPNSGELEPEKEGNNGNN